MVLERSIECTLTLHNIAGVHELQFLYMSTLKFFNPLKIFLYADLII